MTKLELKLSKLLKGKSYGQLNLKFGSLLDWKISKHWKRCEATYFIIKYQFNNKDLYKFENIQT